MISGEVRFQSVVENSGSGKQFIKLATLKMYYDNMDLCDFA